MANNKETRSFAAFSGLLETLREVAESHLAPEQGVTDERDIVEGYRHVAHLLSAAVDLYLEGDPERPAFVKMVSPTRKYLGDNPDAIYHFAPLRGDRSYRIRGRRGDECYLSFSIHGRAADGRVGGAAEPVLADVNDRNLAVAEDGSFEVILSSDEHPGNWIPLAPNAVAVITRHYWEREDAPAADAERRIELRIEALEAPPAAPLDDAEMAHRIGQMTAFVRGATLDRFEPTGIPFVSTEPNQVGQPMVFRMAGTEAWGAVDIAYAMGPFRLEADEALVLEGRFPECSFANVVLWNRYMQTFDYRSRRVSLNRAQTRLEPDGSYRIVIAHRDPGVPNWIDTEGHREGQIFWRFLLPQGEPERPRCRVVPVSSLTGSRAAGAEGATG